MGKALIGIVGPHRHNHVQGVSPPKSLQRGRAWDLKSRNTEIFGVKDLDCRSSARGLSSKELEYVFYLIVAAMIKKTRTITSIHG
jgi:hypothetical protein